MGREVRVGCIIHHDLWPADVHAVVTGNSDDAFNEPVESFMRPWRFRRYLCTILQLPWMLFKVEGEDAAIVQIAVFERAIASSKL